jgi:hypothetical protein
VRYDSGPHHIEVDVHDAASEVLAAFDRRRVMAVLPKSPVRRDHLDDAAAGWGDPFAADEELVERTHSRLP